MQVIKRDGRIVDFDINRIINAINKAMIETEIGIDEKLSYKIALEVENELSKYSKPKNVEFIQDKIEQKLMSSNRKDVAKKYILYREEHNRIRQQLPMWKMTDLQKAIWENKYKYNNETFAEFINRVSNNNEEVKKLILNKKFLPAGRILAGRGIYKDGKKVTLSNCFVIPQPEDNIESIFDTAKEMAKTYSWGGGVGIDISKLRPNGAKVNNAAKTTTGAISFMDLFSLTTELIGQRGRRAALMITLDCKHPDIIEFINCKTDLQKVTKANISIRITDDFMKAVKNNEDWELYFKVEPTGEEIKKKVKAYNMFHLFCKNDWNYAEPSAVFWDRIKSWCLLSEDKEFEFVGLNPCAKSLAQVKNWAKSVKSS